MLIQKNGCVHESFLKLESLWIIPSLRSKLTILQIGGDNLALNVNKKDERELSGVGFNILLRNILHVHLGKRSKTTFGK